MSESVTERIIELVAEKAMLDAESVTVESTLEDLGLDSLSLVELVFAIEEAFGIEIAYNANEPERSDFDISTVGAVADSVRKLVTVEPA